MKFVVSFLLMLFVTINCHAASLTTTKTTEQVQSGFLEDGYALLKPAKAASGQSVMRWVSPKLNSSEYHQIMMEPTQFYPAPEPTPKISAATLKEILHYFDDALGRQLYTVMPVIKNPSPERLASKALHTLKLRVAITAVNAKSKPVAADNIVLVGLSTANLKEKDQPVTLSAEYQVIDAATGEVLAVGMRKGIGKSLKHKGDVVKLVNFKPILDTWANDAGAFFKALRK